MGKLGGYDETSWRYHADLRERDRAVLHRGEQEKIGGIGNARRKANKNGAILR